MPKNGVENLKSLGLEKEKINFGSNTRSLGLCQKTTWRLFIPLPIEKEDRKVKCGFSENLVLAKKR